MVDFNDRIIMAKKDILPLKFPIKQRNRCPKPKGLWYAIGNEWIDWVRSEMPHWEGDYIYKLDLNSTKILFLETYDDIEKFTRKYKIDIDYSGVDVFDINWKEVSENYSGIEISPYQSSVRHKMLWYNGWDVASGCIWKKDGIESIVKIKKYVKY